MGAESWDSGSTPDIGQSPFLEKLKKDRRTLAILRFGSTVHGDAWEKSDIDLFVINGRVHKPYALFNDSHHLPIHVNLLSPRAFRVILKNPRKRTLHSILVGAEILLDRTTWLRRERARLARYPARNKAFQLMERFEQCWGLLNRIAKLTALGRTFEAGIYVTHLVECYFEILLIDRGQYYGHSSTQGLKGQDRRTYRQLVAATPAAMARLEPKLTPLFRRHLEVFLREAKLAGNCSYTRLSERLGLDLDLVYEKAMELGYLRHVELRSPLGIPGVRERHLCFAR